MKKQQVINSIYLVPAIIEYLDGNRSKYINDILNEYGVDPDDYINLINLLKYNKSIIRTNFKADYELLRRGLDEYYQMFLRSFWQKMKLTDTKLRLLDYCGGDGSYSSSFKTFNPGGTAVLLDRSNGLCIDFEDDPKWHKEWQEYFNVVLLSEILHCKSIEIQYYLIDSSLSMLDNGGKIIINENIDPFMGWRLDRLTKEGKVLDESHIIKLMSTYRHVLQLTDLQTIENHKIYVYEKF